MNALSLWQPWASLVIVEEKLWETRSWQLKPGEYALYATRTLNGCIRETFGMPCFKSILQRYGFEKIDDMPFGAVLGIIEILRTERTESIRDSLTNQERAFGNYADLRFCSQIRVKERFGKPIPAKATNQGIWQWQRSAEFVEMDL